MGSVAARQRQILQTPARTREQFIARIQKGLPAAALARVVELGLDKSLVYGLIGSRSTLERRRKAGQLLAVEESDRLARIAELVALAEQVFGDRQRALAWLQRESVVLAGQGAPLRLVATSQGTELVRERLEQIRDGIYA